MSSIRLLGIDQGTTGTKAVVIEPDGTVTTVYAEAHRQFHPGPERVEHDAEELLDHIAAAIAVAGPVDAIGIDHQGETVVGFDRATGRPIHPAIVWLDARTQGVVDDLAAAGHGPLVKSRAGLPLDSYFSASKLAWLLTQVPGARDLLDQGRLALGTSDAFFLYRLTGQFVTDGSAASRTSLMDLRRGQWDGDLCHLFGVPPASLPMIRPTMGLFGRTASGVPILASAVDQQAALYAHDCRQPGDVKFTFGTGGFALGLTGERPVIDEASGLLPTIAWTIDGSATYALDGGIYNAASALDWARGAGLFGDFGEIADFTGPTALERGLVFVPALSGLACPHWDRDGAGLFIGLGLETSRADLARAVLEGVALRAAEVLDAFAAQVPLGPVISVDGGLARNRYFRLMLARASGRGVRLFHGEAAAIGIARLAGRALGAEPTLSGLEGETLWPDQPLAPDLRARFAAAVERAKGWRAC